MPLKRRVLYKNGFYYLTDEKILHEWFITKKALEDYMKLNRIDIKSNRQMFSK